MGRKLLSVGLDVGTTTTQMILSELTVENRSGCFCVPEMHIAQRRILYRSPVHFTPLLGEDQVDGQALRALIGQEYAHAGITREQVDTGAVIITGETSRKENAATVLQALSDFAGDFVVATAGPDLESILAAKGAGAVVYSESTGEAVLHMDIGGGTSNLALIEKGQIVRTGCLNVGGRLVKLSETGEVRYVSPVVKSLFPYAVGDRPPLSALKQLSDTLCTVLESAAGRGKKVLPEDFQTAEASRPWEIPEQAVTVSLSGGVADCTDGTLPTFAFGDIGVLLGNAIRESALCKPPCRLCKDAIRATVIGAGCHSTTLSGSTVFCRNVALPLKNLPVIPFTWQEQESEGFSRLLAERLQSAQPEGAMVWLPGHASPDYGRLTRLAQKIAQGMGTHPVYLCLEQDMAKALGQRLFLHLPEGHPILCLDGLRLTEQSYLDVGQPIGPCYPVVIKTLVLET